MSEDRAHPLRVLVVTQHLGANGGTGAHVSASVAALRRRGHDVVVGAVTKEDSAPADAGIRLVPGIGLNEAPEAARSALLELLDEVQPDLVHVQQLPDGNLVPLIRERSPVVYDVHNYVGCPSGSAYFSEPGDECLRAHGAGCIPRLALRGCAHTRDPRDLPGKYRRSGRLIGGVRTADAVVAHSLHVARHLRSNGVQQPVVVPLFVRSNGGARHQTSSDRVLFSGRLVAAKGVGTLLKAAAAVEAQFDICGDGWWALTAQRLARRLGISDRVTFHGWLDGDALSRAYHAAAIVAVPSHWPEPVGLVGLEAMAHGRPVVASSTGGIPEWLADGETGLLVRPGDPKSLANAIGRLLSDPEARNRMGAAGAARVAQEYSEEGYLDAIEVAYQQARRRWELSRA